MRSGFNGLAAKVEATLNEVPYSGHVFVFRGRRDDTTSNSVATLDCEFERLPTESTVDGTCNP
jgi:hypothetical protein